jgi:hypothetical protein
MNQEKTMTLLRRSILTLGGLALSFAVAAQNAPAPAAAAPAPAAAPVPAAGAPVGATAKCKDDSYYSGRSKRGACSKHGGIAEWYGKTKSKDAAGGTAAGGTAGAAAGGTSGAAAGAAAQKSSSMKQASSEPAPGGGPGKVWVNTSSKVYHCQGDKWYGKTKQGNYMTEAEAKAAGDRPDHGKPCG